MTTTELNLNAWCAQRAVNYRNYEQHEMAMYPSSDDRDAAIVEWTIRVLGNPLTAGSVEALRILAEQHGLELNPAGTADKLADTQHRAHTDATNLQQILRDKTALANENAELRRVAMVYRKAMVGQHNWAGHLINVDCERCDKAADEMDSSFACVEYQNWQREYESALSTGLPKTAEVAK